MTKEQDEVFEEMKRKGWLIENDDGTFTVTAEGLTAADQYKALRDADEGDGH